MPRRADHGMNLFGTLNTVHGFLNGLIKILQAKTDAEPTPAENEQLEFKEAKAQFDTTKLFRYCVALANEGGGKLILGVSDKPPRKVVSTQAFNNLNDIKVKLRDRLRMAIEVEVLSHPDGRVVVFEIPF